MTEQSERILIVDKDERLVAAIKRLFEREGYDVLTAHDGIEALTKAVEEQPDLMILDTAMPALDGYDVCRRLHRHPETASIAVLMLTGKGRTEGVDPRDQRQLQRRLNEQLEGFEAGAVEFMSKPVKPAELLKRAKRLLWARGYV